MRRIILSDEKTVTILGRGPSWKKCPFEEMEKIGDIWATSSVLESPEMRDKHYDLLFAFDNPLAKIGTLTVEENPLGNRLLLAKEKGIPIMSTFHFFGTKYPLLEIFAEFGCAYFRNTISYMIALAILREYKNIYLFGVDQGEDLDAGGTPYAWNKSQVTFWLGVAHARGINYRVANPAFPYRMSAEEQRILKKIFAAPKTKEEYYARMGDIVPEERKQEILALEKEVRQKKAKVGKI